MKYPRVTNEEWLRIHDLAIRLRSAIDDPREGAYTKRDLVRLADRLCAAIEGPLDAQRDEAWEREVAERGVIHDSIHKQREQQEP